MCVCVCVFDIKQMYIFLFFLNMPSYIFSKWL